jgi:hypothetical protein
MSSNIDITKPTSGTATTASVRANLTAAKAEIEALQAADTALSGRVGAVEGDISSLDGRVTVLEQGGGGGGGESYEDVDVGALANQATTTVTHAALELWDHAFAIRANATLPGTEVEKTIPTLVNGSGEAGFDLDQFVWGSESVTWTRDSATTGHFSLAIDADQVKVGIILIVLDGVDGVTLHWTVITGIVGDGTSANDITVENDTPNGTLAGVQGLLAGDYYPLMLAHNMASPVKAPAGTYYHAQLKNEFALDLSTVSLASWTYPPKTYIDDWYGHLKQRIFFSKDAGLTWYGWDPVGGAFVTVADTYDDANIETYGFFTPTNGWYTIQCSNGVGYDEMSLEDWSAWAADATVITYRVSMMTDDADYYSTSYGVKLTYREADYTAPLSICGPVGEYGSSTGDLAVKRTSETSLEIKNTNYSRSIVDLRLRIFGTPAVS